MIHAVDWAKVKRNPASGDEFSSLFRGMCEEDRSSYWYEVSKRWVHRAPFFFFFFFLCYEILIHNFSQTIEDFADMNLKEDLLKGIETCGYQKPTAVQQEAIKPCSDGRNVIVLSQPGTAGVYEIGIAY